MGADDGETISVSAVQLFGVGAGFKIDSNMFTWGTTVTLADFPALISKECTVCHTILSETKTAADFQHPVDIGDLKSVNCADCHTGSGM